MDTGNDGRNRDELSDIEWLVRARNDIQSLMLRLLLRWDAIDDWKRPLAVAAAFSLWRAAFLLVKRETGSHRRVEDTARAFLEKVIRTNAIAFSDDLTQREWSSGYYVQNAIDRIRQLTDTEFGPFEYSPPASVREAWNESFDQLTSATATTVAEDTRIRALEDRLDLLREIDAIGSEIDILEQRFGFDAGFQAEAQAVRQRQQAMRVLVRKQVRAALDAWISV